MSPKIAIVGAGPGGLMLAKLLEKSGLQCTVYEGDLYRHARNQGGSLDIHADGGQLALAEAGLLEEFKKLSRPEGDCLRLLDPTGAVLIDENDPSQRRPAGMADRPEIDRTVLRDMLLDSLGPGTVKWNSKIVKMEAEAGNPGRHTLYFEDGSTETGIDLLVGADGAFSKVRRLVTPEQPHYSGITAIELWKYDVDQSSPWLSQATGKGTMFMFDEGRCVISQRQQNGSIRVYACVRQPLSWKEECGIDWSDAYHVRDATADQYFQGCADDFRRMIRECNDHMICRHLWMLPVGLKWEFQAGVTILGDAAHVMTPFAGVGVNVALADALDLAKCLLAQPPAVLNTADGIADAIASYEASMFVRAEENAKKTYHGLQQHFAASGSQEMAARFAQRMAKVTRDGAGSSHSGDLVLPV